MPALLAQRGRPGGGGPPGRPQRNGGGKGGGPSPWLPVPESTRRLLESARKLKLPVHPGLIITKFVEWNGKQGKADRKRCFEKIGAHLNADGSRELLAAWLARRRRWLRALGDQARTVQVEALSPCLLWLAAPSPLELGFCLHHTYGMPYLPGSGLKGLARASMIRRLGGRAENPPDAVLHLFGMGGDKGHAGRVDFLDGIPLEPNCLEPEVMSPHHPNYYQGKVQVPHDGEDPVPLYFLRIAPGSRFEIAIVARGSGGPKELATAEEQLLLALREMGLGGKTSSGYGLFERAAPVSAESTAAGPSADPRQPSPDASPGKRSLVVQVERFDLKALTVTFRVVEGGEGPVICRMTELETRFGMSRLGWNDRRKAGQRFVLVLAGERIEEFRKK